MICLLSTGKFRIESAHNGTKYECDRYQYREELQCSYTHIYADSPLGSDGIWVGETVAINNDIKDEWDLMAGIMTVTAKQAAHTRLYSRLSGPHESMNVFYDDMKFVPAPKFCDNLVLNGDFEVGDSRFWRPTDRRYIDIEISSKGDIGSDYSMLIQRYTSNGIYQELDTRCLEEGQEFLVSARFQYLNTTDYTTGVDCTPTVLNLRDSRHCPSIKIQGEGCEGPNLEYDFWNDIDQFSWNKDKFNDFEKIVPIGADLAKCNVSCGSYFSYYFCVAFTHNLLHRRL